MNKKFGYARVSTDDQSLNMQIDALEKYGVDQIFLEKESGKKKSRPQLEEMMKQLRPGDSVVIYKLDRIGRNRKHLFELVDYFKENGINFISIQDKIDTSNAIGNMFFGILAVLAQFEADLISERTIDGLKAARARGRKGGRPKKTSKDIELALKMYDSKEFSIAQITDATGVAKTTLYRYIDERKE